MLRADFEIVGVLKLKKRTDTVTSPVGAYNIRNIHPCIPNPQSSSTFPAIESSSSLSPVIALSMHSTSFGPAIVIALPR
jgi:hypothetical protein